MKTIAILSALVSVAVAQTSSLIPSTASAGCKTFLTSLDSDANVQACTSALNSATSAFQDGSTQGTAAVSSALNNACGSSLDNACPETAMRDLLAKFNTACGAEVISDASVKVIYDMLFMTVPMRKALCTKDDQGHYCVTQITKASDGTVAGRMTPSDVQKYLGSGNAPNATTIANANAAFLFIDPTSEADKLCVTCTKNVLTPWINWMSDATYAPGVTNSALIPGENTIYAAVKDKCPSNFLTTTGVQAAGSMKDNIGSSLTGAATSSHANIVVVSLGALVATLFAVAL